MENHHWKIACFQVKLIMLPNLEMKILPLHLRNVFQYHVNYFLISCLESQNHSGFKKKFQYTINLCTFRLKITKYFHTPIIIKIRCQEFIIKFIHMESISPMKSSDTSMIFYSHFCQMLDCFLCWINVNIWFCNSIETN